jgi:hypothetical protein
VHGAGSDDRMMRARTEGRAVMQREEAERRAQSFLSDVSNDESWIDASSAFAKAKLADLIKEVYRHGAASTRTDEDPSLRALDE